MKFLKNNFLVKFVVTLFFIGLIIGIGYHLTFRPNLGDTLEIFKEMILGTHQNIFLSSIIVVSAIFILSLSIVGIPVILFYVFYEGVSIGYTLIAFILTYHIKGAIFYLLFFIISKLIFLVIVGYFSIMSLRYIASFLDHFFSKNKSELYKTIVYHFYRFAIVLCVVILNCGIIYLFANKLIGLFVGII